MKQFFKLSIILLALLCGAGPLANAKVKKSTSKATSLKIIKNTHQYGAELDGEYASGCDYLVTHTVVVANKSGKAVPAGAYYLSISPVGKDYYGYSLKNPSRIPGKAISANGTVTYTWTDVHYLGRWAYEDKVTLKINKQ